MNFWVTEFNNTFADRRIVVTGASGFVGSHLCDALVDLGAKVYGLDLITPEEKHHSQCQTRHVDLADFPLVKAAISEIRPDIIYHLAAMVTAQQDIDLVLPMLRNNLISTVNLLLAANDSNCGRVVIVGSAEEFNEGLSDSPYAASKSAANLYAKMFSRVYGLPVVIVRLFMTYGPRQSADKLIPYSILSFLQNKTPQLSSGERIVDFVYVLDIVGGLLMAGARSNIEGEELELGTGIGIQIKDVIELIAKMMQKKIAPFDKTQLNRWNEKHLVNSSNIAFDLLGWEPHWTLEDGLAETIRWYHAMMENSSND